MWLRRPVAMLLAGWLAVGGNPAGAAHALCRTCHLSEQPVAADLIRPAEIVCDQCHPERLGETEHQLGVALPAGMRSSLPLIGGRIACTTCHDPHQTAGMALRLTEGALCTDCHQK